MRFSDDVEFHVFAMFRQTVSPIQDLEFGYVIESGILLIGL